MLDTIRQKVESGRRITPEEALYLMKEADLLDLAPLANRWRYRHNPDPVVTFVVDTNLNYTNVCDAYCTFCRVLPAGPDGPVGLRLHRRPDAREDRPICRQGRHDGVAAGRPERRPAA